MAKHTDIYLQIVSKVGLKEDREYKSLFNPNDVFGESLYYLALRNFKRFVAVLYYLANEKTFDLLLFGGDSGIGLSKITEIIFGESNIKPPMIICLPVIRWEPKWLNYTGQETKKFDNSIFIPQIKEKINSLVKLENIAFIDDEIANGITAKAMVTLSLKAVDKEKLVKPTHLTIVAEDQNFDPDNLLEVVSCDFYPFATESEDISNVLSYIVPWNIEKQIKETFSSNEMGSKIILNSLLDLPSKEFKRYPEYIIEKPVFTDDFLNKLKAEVPNFSKLQDEFKSLITQWVRESIKEYIR